MPEIMDNVHRYFATTVGLITTNGKQGRNVMAAEWMMHVSYEPMLIAVFVHDSPTFWNIKETRVFGVNIASDDQAELVNIAGGYSGLEINKLAIPHTFKTHKAANIDVPMITGCALNAECKVITIQEMGDHIMVVGEAVRAKYDEKKFPLVYTRGNYRKLSKSKIPTGRRAVRVTTIQMSRFKRIAANQFVIKGVAAVIRQKNKILLQKIGRQYTLPAVAVAKGARYEEALNKHLKSIGVTAHVGKICGIKRLMLKTGKNELRANFIVFDCQLKSLNHFDGTWFSRLPKSRILRVLIEDL